jgi:acetolactate synthase regulatory subunit
MNHAHRPVSFSVDKDHTLDTMEAVLAIARRGGLRLGALQLRSQERSDRIYLELLAPEPDLLDLFMARLHNQIGVDAIDA